MKKTQLTICYETKQDGKFINLAILTADNTFIPIIVNPYDKKYRRKLTYKVKCLIDNAQ